MPKARSRCQKPCARRLIYGPGDRVTIRPRPEGGIVIEREQRPADDEAHPRRLEAIAARRPLHSGPLRGMTTDAIMALLRGDD
jgi:hypothetical protein